MSYIAVGNSNPLVGTSKVALRCVELRDNVVSTSINFGRVANVQIVVVYSAVV